MGDFSLFGTGQDTHADARNTSSSRPIAVTSSGTTNTKGSWVQLISSANFDASGFLLHLLGDSGSGTGNGTALVDIGIGAASSEVVIIPNILISQVQSQIATVGASVYFPIQIPAGTRVAARSQCSFASAPVPVGITLIALDQEGSEPAGGATTYGDNTTFSYGTGVAGGTANNKGSYTQITASTTNDASMLYVCMHGGASTGTTGLLDIAIGGSGSEVIIIPDIPFCFNENNIEGVQSVGVNPCMVGPIPVQIPAGTRIAARIQTSFSFSSINMTVILVEP